MVLAVIGVAQLMVVHPSAESVATLRPI